MKHGKNTCNIKITRFGVDVDVAARIEHGAVTALRRNITPAKKSRTGWKAATLWSRLARPWRPGRDTIPRNTKD